MSKQRAEQIIRKLYDLTQELKDLANNPGAANAISELRTHMGFEKGGWVGTATLEDWTENGSFDAHDDDEEEEE